MLEQPCPAKVLRRKTKTDEVKCGLSFVAQHWTLWRWWCDDEQRATDSLSLNSLKAGSYPPWLSRTQTACKLLNRLPSSQPECQQRLAWMHSHRETTDLRIYSTVYQTYSREASGLCLLSVCLIDHPTTIALPEIAVRDYLFGEPHLFFKWPYLSLKKWDTWGHMGVGMFPVCFLNFLCISMLDTVFVTEDTGHLSFSAFSWWSLYYVKASVP